MEVLVVEYRIVMVPPNEGPICPIRTNQMSELIVFVVPLPIVHSSETYWMFDWSHCLILLMASVAKTLTSLVFAFETNLPLDSFGGATCVSFLCTIPLTWCLGLVDCHGLDTIIKGPKMVS